MRSFANHRLKAPGIDTLVPEPVDMTWLLPGQNVCHVRLTWAGLGVETALAGHVADGTLPITMLAVRPPVVVIDTTGAPVTTGLVYAKAGSLRIAVVPTTVTPPAASRLRAPRRSMGAKTTVKVERTTRASRWTLAAPRTVELARSWPECVGRSMCNARSRP